MRAHVLAEEGPEDHVLDALERGGYVEPVSQRPRAVGCRFIHPFVGITVLRDHGAADPAKLLETGEPAVDLAAADRPEVPHRAIGERNPGPDRARNLEIRAGAVIQSIVHPDPLTAAFFAVIVVGVLAGAAVTLRAPGSVAHPRAP
ncbi:MAG: hypothetical protein WBL53_20745 [Pseudonocardiaceae bacterium]